MSEDFSMPEEMMRLLNKLEALAMTGEENGAHMDLEGPGYLVSFDREYLGMAVNLEVGDVVRTVQATREGDLWSPIIASDAFNHKTKRFVYQDDSVAGVVTLGGVLDRVSLPELTRQLVINTMNHGTRFSSGVILAIPSYHSILRGRVLDVFSHEASGSRTHINTARDVEAMDWPAQVDSVLFHGSNSPYLLDPIEANETAVLKFRGFLKQRD